MYGFSPTRIFTGGKSCVQRARFSDSRSESHIFYNVGKTVPECLEWSGHQMLVLRMERQLKEINVKIDRLSERLSPK